MGKLRNIIAYETDVPVLISDLMAFGDQTNLFLALTRVQGEQVVDTLAQWASSLDADSARGVVFKEVLQAETAKVRAWMMAVSIYSVSRREGDGVNVKATAASD